MGGFQGTRVRFIIFFFAAVACLALAAEPRSKPTSNLGLATALQQAVTRELAGKSGAAVVLDVRSGEILAQRRMDIASQRLAHPGSAIKPFALLAFLQSGKVTPQDSYVCKHELRIAGHKLDCSHVPVAEPMTAVTALAYSCNNYFAHFAERLDGAELLRALARAGLSSHSGLAPREAAGRLLTPATPAQRQLLALGESNVEVTPLELLAAYRRLALKRLDPAPSADYLAIFEGMEGSVAYGTGHAAESQPLRVAGKTGTAASLDGHWTNAWFAGYAPAERPEIVLVVFLERGRGGLDAAAVAREIFGAYQSSSVAARGKP